MTLADVDGALTIGILGAGAMGRGIAQIAVLGGCDVILCDMDTKAESDAKAFIDKMILRLAEKGKIDQQASLEAINRVRLAGGKMSKFSKMDVVIEAIVENIDVKKTVFKQLEDIVSPRCILASNTSSLSISEIASAVKNPARVCGFHFFNPVPLMKIAEVIPGILTDETVSAFLLALGKRFGHTAVRAKDYPGFIVNHAGRGYVTEALHILGEQVASHEELDKIYRRAGGFRMGPFELLDLTALDVSHPVMESIYNQFYQEPRYRPSVITRQRLAAGLLGRKTGQGFYAYPAPEQGEDDRPALKTNETFSIWLGALEGREHLDVFAALSDNGFEIDEGLRPNVRSLCVTEPMGADVTSEAVRLGLNPDHTIGIDLLYGYETCLSLMGNPALEPAYRAFAMNAFSHTGRPVAMLRDSAGFVLQRTLAVMINIASDMAQQGIAAPEDIDTAVKLGLGYPYGPLEWGDEIGATRILTVLENMQATTGDPRYRPSPWLARRAKLGLSLKALEQ